MAGHESTIRNTAVPTKTAMTNTPTARMNTANKVSADRHRDRRATSS
ncbi:hypothetical protein [Fodinicola feengrottensis]|nr:hypothetical protein [Fodinicola feengrottensis]